MYKEISRQSRYCYTGTDVLKNKFGLYDAKQLAVMESMVTTKRNTELGQKPIKGSFDLTHLQKIHKYLFQDIYPFAGKIRSEDISKDGFEFAFTQFIYPQAKEIFTNLALENYLVGLNIEDFSKRAAKYMADINHLHPFREGKGRSNREFIRCLALNADMNLDWSRVPPREVLKASIASVSDENETHLTDVIRRCII